MTIQQIVSLSRREADMSITLTSPRTDFYHYEKITTYRLFIYGSRAYLESHPPIERREDLLAHRLIGYIEDMIFTPGLDYHREIMPGLHASYQSSSIHAQLHATLSGIGLCVLPNFIASTYPELVPVMAREVFLERDYWCVCHQDLATAPRIQALTDSSRWKQELPRANSWAIWFWIEVDAPIRTTGQCHAVLLRTLTGDFNQSAYLRTYASIRQNDLQRLAASLAHQQQERNQD